ncbi:neurexin-3a-beta isoform X3 [Oncorhynchus tshawytscha]|uniref:Laminin G domain-containing protein n=1 Tax=Oncorhynchus tshawytscha TaxID=74940 RepID=A0AAZ3RXU3_ONCTS|nr:neurexin-3a-beta isoform X3 [Oncorhynchus tshawytscha]
MSLVSVEFAPPRTVRLLSVLRAWIMLRPAGGAMSRGSKDGGAYHLSSPLRLRLSPWMWSLTLGCITGSVWSSSPRGRQDNNVAAARPPGQATSYTYPEHQLHGTRHQSSASVSIYHWPASLRGGHAGTTYIFGKGGGLITFKWPANERPSTRTDRLTVGFSTSLKDGILVRIDSAPGLGDYLMLHIEQGKIGVTFNIGTMDISVRENSTPVNDGLYHVVRFTRNGGNATLQVDNWSINEHFPGATTDNERLEIATKKFPLKYARPVVDWLQEKGRQLTIFNTQALVTIGGSDRSRPFQGQLSGLYYNGLKVLNMAAEGNPNIKINGSVRLVGDTPSVAGSARTTAQPPELSTTFIETTTIMSTTTTRKHRSSPTVQQTTDDMVSSAECSSDDEDLEECDSGRAGGLGGELVIPVLLEDQLVLPPSIPLPTLCPPLTINETTKESLSKATEAGVPCLSDRGSDDCDDCDDDDGLVISGYDFDSNLPPTDDEELYATFSLVTDKTLSTSAFEGGYKAHQPKWETKDFRPNKPSSDRGRTTTTAVLPLAPDQSRYTSTSALHHTSPAKLPAGKMNNRELKPQPDVVLLPLPTLPYEVDSTKQRAPVITSPMFHTVPTALPTQPVINRVPGPPEVSRQSSSTIGMVVGIVAAAALCIVILLYAMYKYRNRDEGSYQVDESRNYITNSATQSNGAAVKDKQQSSKAVKGKQKNKDKEYYV